MHGPAPDAVREFSDDLHRLVDQRRETDRRPTEFGVHASQIPGGDAISERKAE